MTHSIRDFTLSDYRKELNSSFYVLLSYLFHLFLVVFAVVAAAAAASSMIVVLQLYKFNFRFFCVNFK